MRGRWRVCGVVGCGLLAWVGASSVSAEPELPVTFEFQVLDYVDSHPISGIEIRLSEDQICYRNTGCRPAREHPEHLRMLTLRTDADGRAVFHLPDRSYGYYVPEHGRDDYIMFSGHYRLGKRERHPLVREEKPSMNEHSYTLYLVPRSLLMVRTREQALEIANANPELAEWLAAQPDRNRLSITVRGGGTTWQVGYGRGGRLKRQVHINAFDGTSSVNGRWN